MHLKRKAFYIVLAAVAVAVLIAVYSPARAMSFVFDDQVTIIKNQKIQAASFTKAIVENPFRSLVNLSFAFQVGLHRPEAPGEVVEYAPFQSFLKLERKDRKKMQYYYEDPHSGKSGRVLPDMKRGYIYPLPRVLPFRAFNLFVHAVSSLLLGLLVFRLRPWKSAAFLTAVAFMFHPLATGSVNYITARFDLMAFAFCLAAVFFHLGADEKPRRDYIALGFFILGLFCKESAASLPVAVLLLDALRGRPRPRVLFALALSALYVVLRLQWMIVLDSPEMEKPAFTAYVLMEQRVFWIYLAKCFCPLHLNFEYSIGAKTVTDAAFALLNGAALAAAGAAAAAKFLSLRSPDKKGLRNLGAKLKGPASQVVLIFAIGWVLLSPTLLIPLADSAEEHRAYPLIGVAMAGLFGGLLPLVLAEQKRKRTVMAVAAAIVVVFAIMSFNRNQDWKNELTLLADSMKKSPHKPRLVYNYADELKWHGRFDRALFWYKRHLEMEPGREDTRLMIKLLEDRTE